MIKTPNDLEKSIFAFFTKTGLLLHTCKKGREGFEVTKLGVFVYEFLKPYCEGLKK